MTWIDLEEGILSEFAEHARVRVWRGPTAEFVSRAQPDFPLDAPRTPRVSAEEAQRCREILDQVRYRGPRARLRLGPGWRANGALDRVSETAYQRKQERLRAARHADPAAWRARLDRWNEARRARRAKAAA